MVSLHFGSGAEVVNKKGAGFRRRRVRSRPRGCAQLFKYSSSASRLMR